MGTENAKRETDMAVWKGQIDLTTATVRISLLLGLGLLWFGLVFWLLSLS